MSKSTARQAAAWKLSWKQGLAAISAILVDQDILVTHRCILSDERVEPAKPVAGAEFALGRLATDSKAGVRQYAMVRALIMVGCFGAVPGRPSACPDTRY